MSKPKLPADPRDYFVYNPEVTLAELARHYDGTKGCSLDNLKKRSRKENWLELRHQHGTKTALKTEEKVAEKTAEIVSDLVVKNPLLGKERLLEELCHVAYFSMADIADVDDGGTLTYKSFSEVSDGAKRALKKIRERRRILSAGEGPGENIVLDAHLEAEPNDKLKAIGMICDLMGYTKPEVKPPEDPSKKPEVDPLIEAMSQTAKEVWPEDGD